jgi:hypothetical protein
LEGEVTPGLALPQPLFFEQEAGPLQQGQEDLPARAGLLAGQPDQGSDRAVHELRLLAPQVGGLAGQGPNPGQASHDHLTVSGFA